MLISSIFIPNTQDMELMMQGQSPLGILLVTLAVLLDEHAKK